ncbi:MAG: ligase-associated DNA damage response endonuclease PdeM [Gemmatimonadaceae bacterium]
MDRLSALELRVAGEVVVLRGDRALYWPRERMLLIADLHLGKTESLRAGGVALPDGVMAHDLDRLRRALVDTDARRLVILGDLVHDAAALAPGVRAAFAAWRASVDASVELVLGNHDRHVAAMPDEWRLQVAGTTLSLGPFRLLHAADGRPAYTWSGHVHPMLALRSPTDALRVPCFHIGAHGGVLPAFSTLTGGAMTRVAPGERAVAVVDGMVIALPTASERR